MPETKPEAALNETRRPRDNRDLEIFYQIFPDAFSEKEPRPLQIGIMQALRLALPDWRERRLRDALDTYTRRPIYRAALTEERDRVLLSGRPSGERVDAEAAARARAEIASRDALWAERRIERRVERLPHTWGKKRREEFRMERVCEVCGLVKVTFPWFSRPEFHRHGELVAVTMAPRAWNGKRRAGPRRNDAAYRTEREPPAVR